MLKNREKAKQETSTENHPPSNPSFLLTSSKRSLTLTAIRCEANLPLKQKNIILGKARDCKGIGFLGPS